MELECEFNIDFQLILPINPYNIFLHKSSKSKDFCQFEITINDLVGSFPFIWIPMLWVYIRSLEIYFNALTLHFSWCPYALVKHGDYSRIRRWLFAELLVQGAIYPAWRCPNVCIAKAYIERLIKPRGTMALDSVVDTSIWTKRNEGI